MRVIGGVARGRPLVRPRSSRTRPTTDKVKGALFSIIETLLVEDRPGRLSQNPEVDVGDPDVWTGLTVLDLYAGTGALGIEALSRGAAWCDFVEDDPRVRAIIERNLKMTGFGQQARLIGADVVKLFRVVRSIGLRAPYGVVFLDPPYADPDIEAVLEALAGGQLLESGALVAHEHSRRVAVATSYPSNSRDVATNMLVEARRRRHGDTEISIYRWREAQGQE